MARVLLLATGDTIAYGRRDGRPAVLTAAELLAALPPDRFTAEVTPEDALTEPSWDMSSATMLALARRVRSAVLDDGYDGVVVTHGTDTVEETAFLTDLLAGPAAARAGIVFTGAVRRADEPSADGPRNLASAIAAARAPALRLAGAVVCANDDLHAARWVSEVDATSSDTTRAAFSSAPFPPVGRVVGGRVETVGTPPPRPPRARGEPASDVALIKTYPGMEPTLLTAAVDAGAAGIVLEGTGPGNVPTSLLAAISDLTDWGIPVVIASRSRTGGADGNGLAAGVGAFGARGLAAPKARLALMVALGAGGADGARHWFGQL
jgi:L-asparaginase